LLGLAFLIVPTMAIAQFFDTAMLTLGLLLGFAKDVTGEVVQRHIGIALLIGSLAGTLVTILGAVSGALRANAWIAIVLYVLFGLGYAHLVFLKKPQTSQ